MFQEEACNVTEKYVIYETALRPFVTLELLTDTNTFIIFSYKVVQISQATFFSVRCNGKLRT